MKKTFFVLLMMLFTVIGFSQSDKAINPALCHKETNEPYPAFFSVQLPFDGFEYGDWIGVYSLNSNKCFGAEEVTAPNGQFPGYADDPTTTVIDGFINEEVMKPFIYSIKNAAFYVLEGTIIDYRGGQVVNGMVYAPLNVYQFKGVSIGNPINLTIDPILSEVVFNFVALELPIVTGASEDIKFEFRSKNTTPPLFTVSLGKGTIIKKWDGYYYKYAATDVNVIINAVGKSNFTDQMLTAQLNLTLDQSTTSNSIYQDENILFYLKSDEVWVKCLCTQLTFTLYRKDGGIEKKSVGSIALRLNGEKKIYSNYTRSWKGQPIRMEYKIRQGNGFSPIIENKFVL